MTRSLMTFPPYCDICAVYTQSISRADAERTIREIFGKIREMIDNSYTDVKVIILGPTPSGIARVNNKYRFRMIIKCKNNKRFREMLKNAINIKLVRDVTVSVDINPETML